MQPRRDAMCRIVRIDFITGDLLPEKAVIGFVDIERINDVVTIAPSAGQQSIVFKPLGFRVK